MPDTRTRTSQAARGARSGANARREPEKQKENLRLNQGKKGKAPPAPPNYSLRAKLVEIALAPESREFFARNIANRMVHRVMGRGLVMPLWHVLQDADERLEGFLPPVEAPFTDADGRLLALPFAAATPVLYYNRQALRSAKL